MFAPHLPVLETLAQWQWIDGTPLWDTIEEYRRAIFTRAFDELDPDESRSRYSMVLCGRAKKNWKTAELVLAALFSSTTTGGPCYILASDLDQAGDDLSLAKLLIRANPILLETLVIGQDTTAPGWRSWRRGATLAPLWPRRHQRPPPMLWKWPKSLVGRQGLEPWTR